MTDTYKGSIREVSAISLLQARNWNAQPREAIISIVGSGRPLVPLKKGWTATLRLRFDDIETGVPGGVLFNDKLADKVLDFLDRIEGKVDHVVVSCNRGLSRGPGIARFITIRCDLSNGFRNHMTFNRHVFRTLFLRWHRRIFPGKGCCIPMGWCRPDDPVYRTGLLIAGRPFPANPKK